MNGTSGYTTVQRLLTENCKETECFVEAFRTYFFILTTCLRNVLLEACFSKHFHVPTFKRFALAKCASTGGKQQTTVMNVPDR
jgi:hypothetical protein